MIRNLGEFIFNRVKKAEAELDKEKINKKGYDSLFSKREGKETGGTLYDEFVVYDPHQAIPRYIVHYKNLNFDPASMPQSQFSTDQNLTRIEYHMSSHFSGDSPAEYHFRLAESQFFRMSSRNDHKVNQLSTAFMASNSSLFDFFYRFQKTSFLSIYL